jgi:hypothetical protein
MRAYQEAVARVRKAEDEWDSSDSNFSKNEHELAHMKNMSTVPDH